MPFVETAALGDTEVENINHFAGIRLRVLGVGNYIPTMYSLDKIESNPLVPLVLRATYEREPTRLCNFVSQRTILRLETTEFDDYFEVNRIVMFTKQLYTQFPGLD